jgi:hypothetical protein
MLMALSPKEKEKANATRKKGGKKKENFMGIAFENEIWQSTINIASINNFVSGHQSPYEWMDG